MPTGESEGSDSLPVTRWSLVARAARSGDPAWRAALSELLTRYLPAMRAHLRVRRRVPAGEVDDLLQGFVASKVLEQDLVAAADARRGRFRTFLFTALDRYALNVARDRGAAKRSPGPGRGPVTLDAGAEVEDPDVAADPFDAAWAEEVVREAVRRTRLECDASGRSDLWSLFDARVAGPLLDGRAVVPYERLVEQLRFDSPARATNALATGKRIFRRMLRGVVGEYAAGDAEVDEELRDLKRILARRG